MSASRMQTMFGARVMDVSAEPGRGNLISRRGQQWNAISLALLHANVIHATAWLVEHSDNTH